MILGWVILGLVLLVAFWLVFAYNRLVTFRTQAHEALADIDVQSKRRFDLIPNLVETVKGYMAHERQVLENLTKARASVASAGGAKSKAEAENMLSGALKSLFAVAENYPDLKANQNFLELQRELTDTEDKLQAARRFYNGTVRDLNIGIDSFPTNMIAGMFGFAKMEFFEVEAEAERGPVAVKF